MTCAENQKFSLAESLSWPVNERSSHYAFRTKEQMRAFRLDAQEAQNFFKETPILSETQDKFRNLRATTSQSPQRWTENTPENTLQRSSGNNGQHTGKKTQKGVTKNKKVTAKENNAKLSKGSGKEVIKGGQIKNTRVNPKEEVKRGSRNRLKEKPSAKKPVFAAYGFGSSELAREGGGFRSFNMQASLPQKIPDNLIEITPKVELIESLEAELPRMKRVLAFETVVLNQMEEAARKTRWIKKPRALSAKITQNRETPMLAVDRWRQSEITPFPASSFGKRSVFKAIYTTGEPLNVFFGQK